MSRPSSGRQAQAERRGVGDDVEHAAPRDVHGHPAERPDLDGRVEVDGERRHVAERDLRDLAVAALGADADQPRRRLERQLGHRLAHRDHAGLEQRRGHADRVGAGHRRVFDLLHDHEPGVGVGMGRRQHAGCSWRPGSRAARAASACAVRRWCRARCCIFSNIVRPGTSRTPPTITRPGSPQACRSTAEIMDESRIGRDRITMSRSMTPELRLMVAPARTYARLAPAVAGRSDHLAAPAAAGRGRARRVDGDQRDRACHAGAGPQHDAVLGVRDRAADRHRAGSDRRSGAADRRGGARARLVFREPRALVAVDARRRGVGAVPGRPAADAAPRACARPAGPDAADDRRVLPRGARAGSPPGHWRAPRSSRRSRGRCSRCCSGRPWRSGRAWFSGSG